MGYRRALWIALTVVSLIGGTAGVVAAQTDADTDADLVAVPEPGTLALLASGVAALGGIGWLRRKK